MKTAEEYAKLAEDTIEMGIVQEKARRDYLRQAQVYATLAQAAAVLESRVTRIVTEAMK